MKERALRYSSIMRRVVLITAGLLITASMPGTAGLLTKMDYMLHSWPREHRVQKLIVTGNYVKPRILAELVQHETKNPVLLISPSSSGNQLFFLPYGPKAMPLEASDFVEFLDLVNPKQVLLLGDRRYIPSEIADKVEGRVSSVRVNSDNWAKNAQTLADMFKYRALPQHFADMYDEVDEASRRSESSAESSSSPALAPLRE